MSRNSDPTRIQLKRVRLSYPALFRPKGFGKNNDGEPAYQAAFLIDPEDKLGRKNEDLIVDAIEEAKIKKWGDKIPKLKQDKICFREGDEDKPEEDGMMVLSARNYKKPKVLDRDKEEVVEADGIPYAGCYVDAIVRIWVQDNEYGKRINCSLEAVRFREDGEPFGAPPVDPDEFDDLDDEDDDRPRRRRNRDDDDDEDEKPRRRRSRDEDGDEDDRPRRRRSRGDDDEDEKPRRRRSRDDDGDEDEKPRRRRSRDEDADEDDRPRRRRSRDEDDDDEDEKPRRRRSRDDDDDDEDRPSRNSRARRSRDDDDDDEEDDRPRRRRSRDEDVV